ncbi:unnamed protein product [Tetraodon nigroviridis]|uniref:TBC1 domain family member 31 n=1 Tax=Tetraodon nigroviridis TaxID=99883 RepID=Q4RFH4_TETNG|nr:unnamed protein product [Tetraodon nigroviridis]
MEVTDVGNREEGRVWHRKPGPGKGLLVTLVRSDQQSRTVRFLHVAFGTTGDSFLAGDHRGNIYMVDVGRNRFRLVQRTGQACTALAFNLRRSTEFLVALADYTIKCFDKGRVDTSAHPFVLTVAGPPGRTFSCRPLFADEACSALIFLSDTKQMVSWMRGHEGAVSFISVHSSGRSAISTSSDTAQLWDLDTFQRKRKLSVRQSVGIQRVFFLPLSNTILSCFSDDSIFAWESDTLSCQYQLPVPDSGPKISYRAFAVTPDGKSLVAGGRSNLIHLWCLDSQKLVRVIQMPTQVRAVRQLEFLPDTFDRGASQVHQDLRPPPLCCCFFVFNFYSLFLLCLSCGQTLGVLSQDGVMRFIDVQTCKLLFHLGSPDIAISTAAVSPNGRHMAAVMDNGSINVYSIHSLTQEFHKLPSTQVAVVSEDEDDRELSKPKVRVRSDLVEKSAKRSGRQSQAKIPTGFPVEDKENQQAAGLSKKRLVSLLEAFGEYPAKYRMFLWRSLLCLPENYTAYSSLTEKGPHSAFLALHNKYPIKSHKLQRCLQRVLSALAHWAAVFGEVDYLPLVAFPFVKLFQNNPLLCFEMLATVIVNWCQHWFEYFPNPPLNILAMVENVLAHHDRKLLQHLVSCGVTSQVYAWPLLETLFSEVLTRDEWLRLFDSVFSNHPAFLLMACVAYVTCCRQLLLKSTQKRDFEYFFRHRNTMDMRNMIKEAYRIMDSTPADIHPKNMLSDFTPLTRGQYPVFNHYPEFLVEYQRRKREEMQLIEMRHLCERCVSAENELPYFHDHRAHRFNSTTSALQQHIRHGTIGRAAHFGENV